MFSNTLTENKKDKKTKVVVKTDTPKPKKRPKRIPLIKPNKGNKIIRTNTISLKI
jgi:hypothetical protein